MCQAIVQSQPLKEEKRDIGKHSIPRPEIDILAFNPKDNEIMVVEAKSYLDSNGVRADELIEKYQIPQGRYKLFTCENYRNVVFYRLKQDLIELGMAKTNTKLRLGLVAGRVYQNRSCDITELFRVQEWYFLSPENIRDKVNALAGKG